MRPSNLLPVMTREESTLMDNYDNLGYLMDWNIITPIHGSEYWVEQMKQKLKLMAK